MRFLRPNRTRMWGSMRLGFAVCCLLSACPAGAQSVYDSVYQETFSGLAWMQDLRRWAQHAECRLEPSFQLNNAKCGCAVNYTRSRRSSTRRLKQASFSGTIQCNDSMCWTGLLFCTAIPGCCTMRRQQLKALQIPYQHPYAKHGIVATLGTGKAPCIVLRTDMDALPIPVKAASFSALIIVYSSLLYMRIALLPSE